jgi:hypothetical protein
MTEWATLSDSRAVIEMIQMHSLPDVVQIHIHTIPHSFNTLLIPFFVLIYSLVFVFKAGEITGFVDIVTMRVGLVLFRCMSPFETP